MPMIDAITRFFAGLGYVGMSRPDPGNRGNAPAPAPVQVADYQEIQGHLILPRSTFFEDVESISPEFRDPKAHGVSVFGTSGLTGGGTETADIPMILPDDPTSYDLQSGDYLSPEQVYHLETAPHRPVHRHPHKPVHRHPHQRSTKAEE